MTEPRRRSDKQLVGDFGAALRAEREWWGWSHEELVRQIKRLPANIRFAGIPAADEVRELEEGEPKKLPHGSSSPA